MLRCLFNLFRVQSLGVTLLKGKGSHLDLLFSRLLQQVGVDDYFKYA